MQIFSKIGGYLKFDTQEMMMKELPFLVKNMAVRLALQFILAIVILNAFVEHNLPLLITSALVSVWYYLYIKLHAIELQFNFICEMIEIINSILGTFQSQGLTLLEEQLNWHNEQIRQQEEKIQQLRKEFDISADADN